MRVGRLSASAVVRDRRDGHRRDTIELVPATERPPRLFAQLRQFHAGLVVIAAPRDEVWRLLDAQVALDGIHCDRRRVINVLVAASADLATSSVGGRVSLPTTSVRRHLEDLTALGVVERAGEAPERWRLSDGMRERWWAVVES